METLKKMYEDLLCCKNNWSYYNNPPCLTYNTLLSEAKSFKFIKKYFSCGGKEELFSDSYIENNADILKHRAPHIISTYLLGIIIAESFRIDLNKRDDNNVNFKYLWFLACLYHDIGYVYEENQCCEYLIKIQTEGLTSLQEICNIKYLENEEFKTYTKEEVNIYLSCRAKCINESTGVIDHGIAGGIMLYDRLIKNFEQAWGETKKAHRMNNQITRESFCHNGLHFSENHYKYYKKAADAIIAHNIWIDTLNKALANEGKEHLQKPESNKPRINKKNQIAFVLALSDTIEPIKKYGIDALDMVCCEKRTNGFKISMPDNECSDTYKYIEDLKTWVDVKVIKEQNNTFLISEE